MVTSALSKRGMHRSLVGIKENTYKWIFGALTFASLFFLVGITIVLFKEGLPLFKEVKAFDVIFGRYWYPTHDLPEYGMLPLILASLWVTAGALFVCIPLGVGSAL